jgi:hypothetical protein
MIRLLDKATSEPYHDPIAPPCASVERRVYRSTVKVLCGPAAYESVHCGPSS